MARFLEVFGLINLISFPVALGLFCLSDLVVALLLGPQWVDAVPILQILGLCGLLGALQGNMYVVMSAMGKPKANTMLSASLLVVSLPAVIWASLQYGVLGAAYAHFVSALVGFVGIVVVFTLVTGTSKRSLISVMWRPLLASALMAWMILIAAPLLVHSSWSLPAAFSLFLLVAMGAVSYTCVIVAMWWLRGRPESAEKVVLMFLASKFLANRTVS